MPLKPISVSQLNEYVSRVLETDPLLGNVTVRGEASGVKYHQSGHVYFSLVDSSSRVNCFLNRDLASEMRFRLTDGMELRITGSVSVYRKGGSYSLYVRHVEAEGAGSLQLAFEELKQKLQKEGLFDPSRKKPLPFFPDRIGIVTSETGAAVKDIMKNIRGRNDHVQVILFPVLVQGDAAAGQIAEAIRTANEKFPDLDLLIVGRGGGSAEDLWAFNEEAVARAIAASEIPVISAVGHEIDFTISDMAADVRAETPTKAAVIAVPDLGELAEDLDRRRRQLETQMQNMLQFSGMKAENLIRSMQDSLRRRIDEASRRVEQMRLTLEYSDPRKILKKGYGILTGEDGTVYTDAGALHTGETYRLTLAKGSADVQVKACYPPKDDGRK